PTLDVSLLRTLCKKLREVTSGQEPPEQISQTCESLLREFLYCDEERFRQAYFDAKSARATRETYSDHLFFAIKTHLDNAQYDAAVLSAFRCLDNHLQRLLKLSSAEQVYGDTLINRAF